MTVHFDTLDFVKTLTAAGVSSDHAEAIARAHAKSMGDLVSHDLATKADLNVLRADMRSANDALRAEMKSANDAMRAEMKSANDAMRAEMKSANETLRADIKAEMATLRADFQTELRSLKYGASIATGLLSLVVVLVRFIR